MKYSKGFSKRSSKILLGTAYFGETISKEDSFSILDRYFELGGNHIDTARLYADGESEKVIGEWIRSRRPKDFCLSTKGAFPLPSAPHIPRVNEVEIRRDLEESLRALGVEKIEFYWLHRDDEGVEAEEIINIMNALVKEGKIEKFGASNWSHIRVDRANRYASENGLQGFDGVQMRFSPAIIAPSGSADRTLVDMDSESFKYYKESGIPVAAYASQAKGFFSKMASVGESGLSVKSRERYLCEENLRRLEYIKELSLKYEVSIAAIVCASLLSINTPDVYPIIGASKKAQVEDSMTGGDLTLEKGELEKIFNYEI